MKTLNLPNEVICSLEKMNITTATEIQKQAIPLAMQGLDILASSQTGSGKTLAYLLPIINSFVNTKSTALVLVPTRELATQIRLALTSVTSHLKMNSAVLIGGEPMGGQLRELRGNPKVIVGTPGRIIDHLTPPRESTQREHRGRFSPPPRTSLKLDHVSLVVLDEMDRMLDMDMKEQLDKILEYTPAKKQVLMFSATMPPHIMALSKKYLNSPHHIAVGSATKAALEITQETLQVPAKDKFAELIRQLNERSGSVIIFVNTKRAADQIARMLKIDSHKAEAIHGNLSQRQRERVISSFRHSRSRILVATDVAARGLDIPHTQHVINYDLPMCPEDYLHRIGRTGRAGAKGFSLSFIAPEDNLRWRAIDRLMNKGESTAKGELMRSNKRRRFSGPNNSRGTKNTNFSGAHPRKIYDNNGNYRKKRAS